MDIEQTLYLPSDSPPRQPLAEMSDAGGSQVTQERGRASTQACAEKFQNLRAGTPPTSVPPTSFLLPLLGYESSFNSPVVTFEESQREANVDHQSQCVTCNTCVTCVQPQHIACRGDLWYRSQPPATSVKREQSPLEDEEPARWPRSTSPQLPRSSPKPTLRSRCVSITSVRSRVCCFHLCWVGTSSRLYGREEVQWCWHVAENHIPEPCPFNAHRCLKEHALQV